LLSRLPLCPLDTQVDGRFRVACALKALWYLAPGGKVMVHDWEREFYRTPLLRFYVLHDVTSTGYLGVLTPKPLTPQQWVEAEEALAVYALDSA
jgi:hypothetical protein